MHYIEKGEGPDLLLVHGLNGSANNFSFGLMDLLAKNYHVIAVDRPGSGYSDEVACEDSTLPLQAKFLVKFIQKMKLDTPYVVGHSLGGAVSLELALDHPEVVRKLILLSPLTQFQKEIPDPFKAMEIRSKYYRYFYSRLFATPEMMLNQKKAMAAIYPDGKGPEGFGTRGGGYVAADYISFYNASCDLAGLEFTLAPLAARYLELRVPVSILYGTEDKILNPKLHGEQMRDLNPAIEYETLPGGHLLLATDPEKVAEFIRSKAI